MVSPIMADEYEILSMLLEPTPIGTRVDAVASLSNEAFDDEMIESFRDLFNMGEIAISETDVSFKRHHSDQWMSDHGVEMKRPKMSHFTTEISRRLRPPSPHTFPQYCFEVESHLPLLPPTKATYEETPKKPLRQAFRQSDLHNWATQYEAMAEFRTEHGHCFVPNNYSENPKLSRWVKRQRYQYKLKQEGQRHTLTPDRQIKLEALGFIWDAHKVVWEERYLALLRYRNQYGSTQVPFYFQDKKLAIWVKCQRRHYRLYQQGKPSSMTPERLAKLEKINFEGSQ